jgi:hypothetical protein
MEHSISMLARVFPLFPLITRKARAHIAYLCFNGHGEGSDRHKRCGGRGWEDRKNHSGCEQGVGSIAPEKR